MRPTVEAALFFCSGSERINQTSMAANVPTQSIRQLANRLCSIRVSNFMAVLQADQ
jgi:hypothetical protein